MKYLSIEEIRELDRQAVGHFGMPSLILMENAGRAVSEETLRMGNDYFGIAGKLSVAVICGSGNNAGDGFVAARCLWNAGNEVSVFLLKDIASFGGDALVNLEILRRMNVPLEVLAKPDGLEGRVSGADVIIDAITGTGLKGELKGGFRQAVDILNGTGKPLLAVDVPSGMDGNTGQALSSCIRARLTVTMGFLKKGFSHAESRKYTGKVHIADIGYPSNILEFLPETVY